MVQRFTAGYGDGRDASPTGTKARCTVPRPVQNDVLCDTGLAGWRRTDQKNGCARHRYERRGGVRGVVQAGYAGVACLRDGQRSEADGQRRRAALRHPWP